MNIPKFRAWYKVNKKMYDVLTLDIIDKKVLIENNEDKEKPLRGYVKISEVELMQSTGLKDKTGVEIFEGDVIEVDDYGKIIIADIKHGEYDYSADDEYECHRYGWYINHVWNGYVRNTGYCLNVYKSHCEVIGNIYENPELLERSSK